MPCRPPSTNLPPTPQSTVDPYQELPRSVELGKLVERLTCTLTGSSSWLSFLQRIRGKSCLHPKVGELPHPAAPYLATLRSVGATVTVNTPPWTLKQKDQAMERGSHQSSRSYLGFLESEMVLEFSPSMVVRFYISSIPHVT